MCPICVRVVCSRMRRPASSTSRTRTVYSRDASAGSSCRRTTTTMRAWTAGNVSAKMVSKTPCTFSLSPAPTLAPSAIAASVAFTNSSPPARQVNSSLPVRSQEADRGPSLWAARRGPSPASVRHGLEPRQVPQVAREPVDQQREHRERQGDAQTVRHQTDRHPPEPGNMAMQRETRIHRDQDETHFGGAEPPVGEPERAEHGGLEIDVDRQPEIDDDQPQCDAQADVGREPQPDSDRGG